MDVLGRNGIAERGPTVGDVVQKWLGEVTGARQNSTIARGTRGCGVVQRFGFRGRDKGQDGGLQMSGCGHKRSGVPFIGVGRVVCLECLDRRLNTGR